MEDKYIYAIMTFSKLEINELGFLDVGSTRVVGYYKDLQKALNAVTNNSCDLNETIYSYAVVEAIEEGLYPSDASIRELMIVNRGKDLEPLRWWFKYDVALNRYLLLKDYDVTTYDKFKHKLASLGGIIIG